MKPLRSPFLTNHLQQPDEPEEDGEVAEDEPTKDDESTIVVPQKLHLRGVDTLHTDDIKAYVQSNFGSVDRVEWIDDTSANLLFPTESTARDAIVALSAIEIADASALPVGETIPAKPIDGKPEITLTVRFAVQSDRKEKGAALRSRYYLLHPEHDPEERRRKQQDNRSRYRDRDGRDRDGYDRRRSYRSRRDSDEIETFEASMYDDAPREERRRSASGDRRSYAQENRGKELFAGRSSRRDRSASPLRDRDGDAAMDSSEFASSSNNRSRARDIRGRLSSDNRNKELFPSKASSRGGHLDRLEAAIGSAHLREEDIPKVVSTPVGSTGGSINIRGAATERGDDASGFSIKGAANAKELFPGKLGSDNSGKELFDGRSKQRQKAQDLFG